MWSLATVEKRIGGYIAVVVEQYRGYYDDRDFIESLCAADLTIFKLFRKYKKKTLNLDTAHTKADFFNILFNGWAASGCENEERKRIKRTATHDTYYYIASKTIKITDSSVLEDLLRSLFLLFFHVL